MAAKSRSHPKYGSATVKLKAATKPATTRPIRYTHFQTAPMLMSLDWDFCEAAFFAGILFYLLSKKTGL
jgi:hypothetical protein